MARVCLFDLRTHIYLIKWLILCFLFVYFFVGFRSFGIDAGEGSTWHDINLGHWWDRHQSQSENSLSTRWNLRILFARNRQKYINHNLAFDLLTHESGNDSGRSEWQHKFIALMEINRMEKSFRIWFAYSTALILLRFNLLAGRRSPVYLHRTATGHIYFHWTWLRAPAHRVRWFFDFHADHWTRTHTNTHWPSPYMARGLRVHFDGARVTVDVFNALLERRIRSPIAITVTVKSTRWHCGICATSATKR